MCRPLPFPLLLALLVTLPARTSSATTLVVPSPAHPTIQSGIDADPDTLLIVPGDHSEDLIVPGRLVMRALVEGPPSERPSVGRLDLLGPDPLRVAGLRFRDSVIVKTDPATALVSFESCTFDSALATRAGSGRPLRLEDCTLRGQIALDPHGLSCVRDTILGALRVSGCVDSVVVDACTFLDGPCCSLYLLGRLEFQGNLGVIHIRGSSFAPSEDPVVEAQELLGTFVMEGSDVRAVMNAGLWITRSIGPLQPVRLLRNRFHVLDHRALKLDGHVAVQLDSSVIYGHDGALDMDAPDGTLTAKGNDLTTFDGPLLHLRCSAELKNNNVHSSDMRLIDVAGPRVWIEGNEIGSSFYEAIVADGQEVVVRGNRIGSTEGSSIAVTASSTCEIADNEIRGLNPYGVGISVSGSCETRVEGNLVAGLRRDGIVVSTPSAVIARNTIRGMERDGIVLAGGANSQVTHNLVALCGGWGLSWDGTGSLSESCNDWFANDSGPIQGLAPAATDLQADPLFCGPGDYTLHAASPCVNAPSCGAIGSEGVGCGPVGVNGDPPPGEALILQPNPARGPVRLSWTSGPEETPASIRVVDVTGRTVFHRVLASGATAFIWSMRDAAGRRVPPGLYFVHARTGSRDLEARLVAIE